MRTTTMRCFGTLAALLLAGTATGAHAQFSGDPGSGASEAPAGGVSKPEPGRKEKRAEGRRTQRTIDVSPYLEVGQVLTADLKNGGDVLTYTTVAAGIDAPSSRAAPNSPRRCATNINSAGVIRVILTSSAALLAAGSKSRAVSISRRGARDAHARRRSGRRQRPVHR
jgi:hypothetical protein